MGGLIAIDYYVFSILRIDSRTSAKLLLHRTGKKFSSLSGSKSHHCSSSSMVVNSSSKRFLIGLVGLPPVNVYGLCPLQTSYFSIDHLQINFVYPWLSPFFFASLSYAGLPAPLFLILSYHAWEPAARGLQDRLGIAAQSGFRCKD